MVPLKPTPKEQAEIDLCQLELLAQEYGEVSLTDVNGDDICCVSQTWKKPDVLRYFVSGGQGTRKQVITLLAKWREGDDA